MSEQKRIMIIRSSGFPQEWVDELQDRFSAVSFVVADDNEESIYSQAMGIHALVGCPRFLFTPRLLKEMEKTLEWVHASGAGIEEFLFPEFVQSRALFTNGKIIQGPEVSDHAMALLLALTRNIHLAIGGTSPREMPRPIELRSKTVLIYGVGGIGMLVAEKAKAFGMHVIAVDEDYVPMMGCIDEACLTEALPDHLPKADVVICSCPNTQRSRFTFRADAFRAMKPEAIFINVSRGQLVNTDELVEVLLEGRLRGVGLDVTEPEPLPDDHPLRNMNRVIITPHIAGPSDWNRRRSFVLIRSNMDRFLGGRPLLNVVDKQRGY